MSKKEFAGKIEIKKFDVVKPTDDQRMRWKQLAVSVQRLQNHWRMKWLAEHLARGDDDAVREWMESDAEWAKTPKAQRGKRAFCPVEFCDSEMGKAIYRHVTAAVTDLNMRPLVLALNVLSGTFRRSPASKSAYPRWMRALAGFGEMPSSSRPQPIPFDHVNTKIIPPANDKDDWKLQLRIDRIARDGRPAIANLDTVVLQTRGKRCRGYSEDLYKLATGEWQLAGSHLVFNEQDGSWSAHLCCRQPVAKRRELNPDRVLVLTPGKYLRAWNMRAPGQRTQWVQFPPQKLIYHVRRQLRTHRFSYHGAYKVASSARKGHGRKRAIGKVAVLTQRWKDFVKTCNNTATRRIIEYAAQQGCGTIVYYQPVEKVRERRFLSTAGKDPGRVDNTLWDWYQVTAMLQQKAVDAGISVEVRRLGERFGGAKHNVTARNPNGKQVKALQKQPYGNGKPQSRNGRPLANGNGKTTGGVSCESRGRKG